MIITVFSFLEYKGIYLTSRSTKTSPAETAIWVIILIGITIQPLITQKLKAKISSKPKEDDRILTLHENTDALYLIQTQNPNLSNEQILQYCKSVFVKTENALLHNDTEMLRNLETDELFSIHTAAMKGNTCATVDDQASAFVENAVIDDFNSDSKCGMLTVLIDAAISQTSHSEDVGTQMKTYKGRYRLGFTYPLSETISSNENGTMRCPSCSAPVDIYKETKCPYCGMPLERNLANDFSKWKLCAFENVYAG